MKKVYDPSRLQSVIGKKLNADEPLTAWEVTQEILNSLFKKTFQMPVDCLPDTCEVDDFRQSIHEILRAHLVSYESKFILTDSGAEELAEYLSQAHYELLEMLETGEVYTHLF